MRWALLLLLASGCGDSSAPDPGWMSSIADERNLAELSIPGTHESAARYEVVGGSSKCQNLTLAEQLQAGVRFFDIRCRHIEDAFLIHHHVVFQMLTFDDVLATMLAFLDAHPMQTVIMSVKEEYTPEGTTRTFAETFETYVSRDPARWYLSQRLPTLGEVRGKIVLLRRFPSTATPLGIDADSMWADDTTFTMATNDAMVRVQDDYLVDANDVKWQAITALLDEAKTGPVDTWYLNFSSGYQKSGALPEIPIVATDINDRLDVYFAEPANATGRLGTLAMDFVTESRIRRVIEHNQ